MMCTKIIACFILLISLMCLIIAQVPPILELPIANIKFGNAQIPQPEIKSTALKSPISRVRVFADAFFNALQNSPQLLKIFDISVLASEASTNVFHSLKYAIENAGIKYADTLAKVVADALYQTLPLMTQKIYIYAVGDTMAIYLFHRDILRMENAASYGKKFADTMLKYFPKTSEVNPVTLSKTLSNAIVDYLVTLNVFEQEGAAAFSISAAKRFFALTTAKEPTSEVSVLSSPGTIPSAAVIFGLDVFESTFLNAVEESAALKSIFYTDEPKSSVSEAWRDATFAFCSSIDCGYADATVTIAPSIMLTYDSMTKQTFVKCFANGYALLLLGIGHISSHNAALVAIKFAKTIENLLINSPLSSNLTAKVGFVYKAFEIILKPVISITNLFGPLILYVSTEYFAVTGIKRGV